MKASHRGEGVLLLRIGVKTVKCNRLYCYNKNERGDSKLNPAQEDMGYIGLVCGSSEKIRIYKYNAIQFFIYFSNRTKFLYFINEVKSFLLFYMALKMLRIRIRKRIRASILILLLIQIRFWI